MNNADPLDIDSLKLIDYDKYEDRYNRVSLYFGDTECEDYWGDDWNDAPYEHNAGIVYREYVKKMEIIILKNAVR